MKPRLLHLRNESILLYKNIRERKWHAVWKQARRPLKYAAYAGVATILLIPIITYFYFIRDMSTKDSIINKKNAGVILLDRNEQPFFTLFNAHTKHPVVLADLKTYTPRAFVAIEDKDFYRHPGFSVNGIGRAIRENLLHESFSQGGSTISQQLIKNAILSPDKHLLRKYQELVLAVELERRFSKDDILEMYINTSYYGEGAFGLQDAAQTYFSKDAKDLTLAESALLAGVINAPSALSPISGNVSAALTRKDLVLAEMQQQGYITTEEETAAQAQEIKLNPKKEIVNNDIVHFALTVRDMLIKQYGEQGAAQSGFVVKTTLDAALQKTAQSAVARQVAALKYAKVTNGAAVVIDPKTAEVLALVGSHDWTDEKNGQINMALRPRQPGSSFKPLIYARAIDKHLITSSTQIDDKPTKFGTYEPKNYDKRYHGKVLVRYALANSLNIPAVDVMQKVGVADGIQAAQDMGITTLNPKHDYGLPLVLGAAEVPLIEMTNAYATFANGGEWQHYRTYTEIKDKTGKVVWDDAPAKKRALSAGASYVISSILSDNKARADSFGGALTMSRQAAVKTGTTEDYRDALTIGYTPQVVVGVWIGNNDNTPMNSIAGSLGAAPIWRQLMEAYLRGKPVKWFDEPFEVEQERVCYEDGQKIDFATSSAYLEYFLRGTKPTGNCGVATPTPSPGPTDTPEPKPTDMTVTAAPTTAPTSQPTAAPILPTATPLPNVSPTVIATPIPTITL